RNILYLRELHSRFISSRFGQRSLRVSKVLFEFVKTSFFVEAFIGIIVVLLLPVLKPRYDWFYEKEEVMRTSECACECSCSCSCPATIQKAKKRSYWQRILNGDLPELLFMRYVLLLIASPIHRSSRQELIALFENITSDLDGAGTDFGYDDNDTADIDKRTTNINTETKVYETTIKSEEGNQAMQIINHATAK